MPKQHTKEKHREKLLVYLSNPSNEMICREKMASDILGIVKNTLYQHFTPQELTDIELEALEERRKRYAPRLSQIDSAMMRSAEDGDATAAKLIYQKIEGWSEKQKLEHSGPGGGPVEISDTERTARIAALIEIATKRQAD